MLTCYGMPVTWHACTCLARVRATKPGFSSKFQCKLFTATAMRSLRDITYKLFTYIALSGYAYIAIYYIYAIKMLEVFEDNKEEVKFAN